MLQHNQPQNASTSSTTIVASISDDGATVTVKVLSPAGNEACNSLPMTLLISQIDGIQHQLNTSWQSDFDPLDIADMHLHATGLTASLLGSAAMSILKQAGGGLLTIQAPLPLQRVPWESLLIGDQPIGELFAVGRHVTSVDRHDPGPWHNHRRGTHVAAVPSADLTWTGWELPAVRSALRLLALDNVARFSAPQPSVQAIDLKEIHRHLLSSRWLHFAGHAESASGGRGWVLESGWDESGSSTTGVLAPSDVQSLPASTPEVVFAHGCSTMQIPPDSESTLCMVEALLVQGTRWLIGPTVPTLDNECRHLVEPFYEGIVRGLSIGEALRLARVQAAQRCPAARPRWLSYVMFGDPSERFVDSTRTGISAPSHLEPVPFSLPLVNQPEMRQLDCDLPALASMLDSASFPEPTSRPATDDSQSEKDEALSETRQVSQPDGTNILSVEEPDPREKAEARAQKLEHFQFRFQQALSRFTEYRDFRTGQRIPAKFEVVADGSCNSWTVERFGKKVSMAAGRQQKPQTQQFQLVLTRETARRIGHAPDDTQASGNLPGVRLIVHSIDAELPPSASTIPVVTVDRIRQLLAEHRTDAAETSRSHAVHIVVASAGFTSSAITEFGANSLTTACSPGMSVVLIDLHADMIHYRPTDLSLMPLLGLFDLSDEEREVQRVVEHVARELPLAASLGLRTVADEIHLPERIVAAGFRVAATRFQLRLDDLPKHGLVLSQDTGSINRTPEDSSRGIHQ